MKSSIRLLSLLSFLFLLLGQAHGQNFAGGFSFYLESEPDFEELVAALGRQPEIIRVRARVVRA